MNILDVLVRKTGAVQSTNQAEEKLPKLDVLPKLKLKSTENVLVESAESLDSFVCHFSRFDLELNTIDDMVYEVYHGENAPGGIIGPLEVGDLIAAMFAEDETWYRAFVSGKNPDGSVEVTFVDYGNKEVIPHTEISRRAKPLNKEFLRYPAMRGVECALSRVGIDGEQFSWTARAHQAFAQYVVGRSFKAKMNSEVEPYCVNLEEDCGSGIHSWLKRERLLTVGDADPEVVQEDYYELDVDKGTSCDVYVTFVVTPEQFYVQQAVNGEAFDKGTLYGVVNYLKIYNAASSKH